MDVFVTDRAARKLRPVMARHPGKAVRLFVSGSG